MSQNTPTGCNGLYTSGSLAVDTTVEPTRQENQNASKRSKLGIDCKKTYITIFSVSDYIW